MSEQKHAGRPSYLAAATTFALLPMLRNELKLRTCVIPLEVRTGVNEWPLRWSGTALLTCYNGRYFCVFTRHQLHGGRLNYSVMPQDIGIPVGPRLSNRYSGTRITWREGTHTRDGDDHDVAAIEITCATQFGETANFFHWTAVPTTLAPTEALFVLGYPDLKPDDLLIGEDGSLRSYLNKQVLLEVATVHFAKLGPSIAEVRTQDFSGQLLIGNDFSGLSGSPLFGFDCSNGCYRYHGMVVRGGTGIVRFLPASWIDELLSEACSYPHVSTNPIAQTGPR